MTYNPAIHVRMRRATAPALIATLALIGAAHAADEPLMLARDGYFYVGGRTTTVDGRAYVSHQMYVEVRVPAKQTHRVPIIMVHGGTMSGTNRTSPGAGARAISPPPMGRPATSTATMLCAVSSRRRSTNCGRKRICTRSGPGAARRTIRRRCN